MLTLKVPHIPQQKHNIVYKLGHREKCGAENSKNHSATSAQAVNSRVCFSDLSTYNL